MSDEIVYHNQDKTNLKIALDEAHQHFSLREFLNLILFYLFLSKWNFENTKLTFYSLIRIYSAY